MKTRVRPTVVKIQVRKREPPEGMLPRFWRGRWLVDPDRFRGKKISLKEWTDYEPAHVRRGLGGRMMWWHDLRDPELAIREVYSDGTTELVSRWARKVWSQLEQARDELQNYGGVAQRGPSVIGFDAVVADMTFAAVLQVAPLHRGEAAVHYVDHLGGEVNGVGALFEWLGLELTGGQAVEDNLKYGRERKGPCRFCRYLLIAVLPPFFPDDDV